MKFSEKLNDLFNRLTTSYDGPSKEDEEFERMVSEKVKDERKDIIDEEYLNKLVNYIATNEPNYLIVKEQEEVSVPIPSNNDYASSKDYERAKKIRKFIVSIASFIAISYAIFMISSKRNTKEDGSEKPSISSYETVSDEETKEKRSISGEQLYKIFIQYAKDNDLAITRENYVDFLEAFEDYFVNGGTYPSRGDTRP